MRRTQLYLGLCIIGYLLPNYFVFIESMKTGNIWLIGNLDKTITELFATNISTAMSLDLIWVAFTLFIWMIIESRRLNIRRIYVFILLALLFGIAGTLPLFLYYRELAKTRLESSQ